MKWGQYRQQEVRQRVSLHSFKQQEQQQQQQEQQEQLACGCPAER
jgi:hypothetical protein